MTWTLNTETGELHGPDGQVRTTLDGPPYRIPDDAQKWAEQEFRKLSMADLTTDVIADYAQLWVGDIETGTPPSNSQ
jgi:hypothetical protein